MCRRFEPPPFIDTPRPLYAHPPHPLPLYLFSEPPTFGNIFLTMESDFFTRKVISLCLEDYLTTFHRCFSRFLNYSNGTKWRKAFHIFP